MKFGMTPIHEAEGSFLAHAHRVGEITFKKGRVLNVQDIELLGSHGIQTVMACRLELGDVTEDEAAAHIATVVQGSNIKADLAFTGRVNLRAAECGILTLDRSRIDRLNAVHEAITLATLPSHAAVHTGQMLATVKIIPFAIEQQALDLAIGAVGDSPLLDVAIFKTMDVVLVQTRLPSTRESVLDKTVGVTAGRLTRLKGRLTGEIRCQHDVEQLAEKLKTIRADLILIAGASAITDRCDILPLAIEAAGGTVEHFGMPVDPGNLLLLGRLGSRPVIGLPGCARSPKLNGFDWVLQRLFAGLDVGANDIMQMGVGGLLTEIPSRPQPRDRRRNMKGDKVIAVLLAAGQSTRMGKSNKLLTDIDGRAMVLHAVDAMLKSKVKDVFLVTGHQEEQIRKVVANRPLTIVHNPDYAAGLSTSLKAALNALPQDADGVLIGLGDMPRIQSGDIDRLIAAFDPDEGRSICVPTVGHKRGNPVLFSTDFVDEMLAVEGDVGARHLIGSHADQVVEIEMDNDATLIDVDTEEALAALIG